MKKLLFSLSLFVCQSVSASLDVPFEERRGHSQQDGIYRAEGGDFSDLSQMIRVLRAQDPINDVNVFYGVEWTQSIMMPNYVAHMVRHLPLHVTSLDISLAQVNDDVIQAISEALEDNKLTSLSLYSCGLMNTQVKTIAHALEKNTSLKELDLVDHGVSSEGIAYIFRAFEKNDSVRLFDFVGNAEKPAIAVLAKAMKTNYELHTIYCVEDGECQHASSYGDVKLRLAQNRKNASNRHLNLKQRLLAHCYDSGFFAEEAEASGQASSSQALFDDRFAKRDLHEPQEDEEPAKRQRR